MAWRLLHMIGSQAARARLEHWAVLYDTGILGMICSDVLTIIDELERHMYAEISAQHEHEREHGTGPDDTADDTESDDTTESAESDDATDATDATDYEL